MATAPAVRALLPAAALVFIIHAAAWPLSLGRTGGFQFLYYFDFQNRELLYPALIGYPPLSAFLFSWLLETFGGYTTECVLAAGFIATIWFTYRAGAVWGANTGLATAIALLFHASYGSLFHRIDSDVVFAVGFAAWMCYALRHAGVDSVRVYAIHGLAVALLTLTRPANQVLLAFAVFPLLLGSRLRTRRFLHTATFLLVAGGLLGGWALLNQARFGDSGSRFRNAVPLFGLMANARIVRADNGPASAKLADAVQRQVLAEPRYAERGIDIEKFFADGTGRAWEAMLQLSDTNWGWDSKYQILRDAAWEAIRRNPGEFVLGVTGTFLHTFILRSQFPVQWSNAQPTTPVVDPVSTNKTLVPPAEISWSAAARDGRAAQDLLKPARSILQRRVDDAVAREFGYRNGIPVVAEIINAAGTVFVPMVIALGIAVIALPWLALQPATKPAEAMLATLLLLSIGLLVVTAVLTAATLEYRLPLDPLFLLSALVGGRAMASGRRRLAARSDPMRRTRPETS
jgi:hypothetical protein